MGRIQVCCDPDRRHLRTILVFDGKDYAMSLMNRSVALWNRPDRVGLLATIAFFVGATIILNGIIFGFGIDRSADALAEVSWAPPGWAVGAIWVVLFSLYAVTYWLLLQRGEIGRNAAFWVLAIAGWDLAYPLLTNGFELRLGAWLNVVTTFFTAVLLWRVWRVSRIAFGWLLPSLVWVCFATLLTFVALRGV